MLPWANVPFWVKVCEYNGAYLELSLHALRSVAGGVFCFPLVGLDMSRYAIYLVCFGSRFVPPFSCQRVCIVMETNN